MQQQLNKSNKMGAKRLMKFKLITLLFIAFFLFAKDTKADTTHATNLNGSTQYFSITDAAQTGLDITGDFTLEAWVMFDVVNASQKIVAKSDSSSQKGYDFYLTSGGDLRLIVSDDGSAFDLCDTDGQIFTGSDVDEWRHVAVTVDISGPTYTFYKGGSSQAHSCSLSKTSVYNNTSAFYVGAGYSGGVTGYLDGDMDEVRIWNDVRTPTEISDNYDCGLQGDEANLQALFRFDNDATDETSNSNDLTAYNTPTYQSGDLPFSGDCGATSSPATSTTEIEGGAMPIENDLSVITGYVEIYTTSTTTPSEIRKIYYHVPFFVWYVVFAVSMFIIERLYSILSKNEKK